MNILITAALPYANGPLHLGHIRSTYLPADIAARYYRLKGENVIYVCATDEHGAPITINAEKEGKSPEEFVEYYHKKDKEEFQKLGFSMDIFHRTHSKENITLTQHFFLKLKENGYIYKKKIEQYYCPKCQRFLPDRYVKGKCPYCGAEDQYGDQCEVCGKTLKPGELINPRCAICGSKPILKETQHYFFKLSEFSEKLEKWISEKNFQPEVKNYVLGWIREGLKDWDITRNLSWGVPVPGEKDLVFYVWFDAPIGYISSTMALTEKWEDYWKNPKAKIMHFIGKDIIYHHYLFWPAMLMGVDDGFKLPDEIPVRGYLNLEGKKFSKSRGWYITLEDYLKVFPPDYLRYYETIITPYSIDDATFSLEEFKERVNNELIANFGNLAYRLLKLTESKSSGEYGKGTGELQEEISATKREVEKVMDEGKYKRALERIMGLSSKINAYLNEKEPWKEENPHPILSEGIQGLRSLAVFLYPFIPFSIEKLAEMVEIELNWESIGKRKEGKIKKVERLFDKVEERQLNTLRSLLQ